MIFRTGFHDNLKKEAVSKASVVTIPIGIGITEKKFIKFPLLRQPSYLLSYIKCGSH